jgi:hypothetical protein
MSLSSLQFHTMLTQGDTNTIFSKSNINFYSSVFKLLCLPLPSLQVIKFLGDEQDQITFVTRAVRVVDLITNLDMAAFQSHSGLSIFIYRLEVLFS